MTLITENGSFTEPSFDIEDDYQIYADAKNIDKDLKSLMPKTTKTKKATLCNNVIREVSRKIKKVKSENLKAESKMPNLEINYDERSISFDGNKFDMNSNVEGIKSDLTCYFEYMQGFDAFSGDVEKNRLNYFRFAVWCLASPFMPLLRNVAKVNKYDSKQFPVYAILYGESNGGKTDYATLLTKMMCGQNIPVNRNSDFTRTTIDGLKQNCKGLPIIIDDLDRVHYTQNASSIIKYDDWGFKENLTNYPSVIITTNELPSVKQEISKRTYICYIDSYIDKSKGRSNHKKIHDCIDKLTNSFYCEYVKRMFDEVNLMCNEMNKGDEKYLPDIFEASSRIILDIIDEFWDGEKPKYLSKCCYEDYFGNKAVGKNAINKIKKAWKLEPEMFTINKKKNQLIYKLSEDAESWQRYELKYLEQELPPSLNCIRVQNSLTMDLDEAKEFFEIEFKKKNKFFN